MGIPNGPNNKQVSDGGDYGRLAGGENPEDLFQPYPDSVQNSSKCIYDYYSEEGISTGGNPFLPTDSNHYASPAQPSCPTDLAVTGLSAVPGPYTSGELFSTQDVQEAFGLAQAAVAAAPDILYISSIDSQPNGIDTFVASTSGKPEDVISYATENDKPLSLNNLDGGFM